MWRLQETSIRNEFIAQFKDKSSTIAKSGGVESMWKSIEADSLESADTVWLVCPDIESHGGGMTLLFQLLKKSVQLGNVGKMVVVQVKSTC